MCKKANEVYTLIDRRAARPRGGDALMSGYLQEMAGEIGAVYGREAGGLAALVPACAGPLSGECFRAFQAEPSPEAAECLFRSVVWRTGLFLGMLAACPAASPADGTELLAKLARRTAPPAAESAPEREVVVRLLTLAEGARSLEDLSGRILWRLSGPARGSREDSPVLRCGHPVDSGLVKLLDTPVLNEAFRSLVNLNADTAMGQILASGVPVTSENFPRLNRIVEECAETLRIPRPYAVVTSRVPGMNAMTFGSDEKPYLAMTGLLVHRMTEEELRFVVGHECGHIAMGHVVYHTAAAFLGEFSRTIPVAGPLLRSSAAYPLNAWARRSEITADRAGLLCCGGLEQAEGALLRLEIPFQNAGEIDLESYKETSRRYLSQGRLRRLGEYRSGHPLTAKRMEALDLFARSAACARAAGRAVPENALSDAELSRETERILRVL